MWKGIDVSDNQGVIDWEQVATAKVSFAILRSVRRSGKADHQFATNLESCRKHNIPVSVYKYTYAATQDAARQEAQQVVALLQSYGSDWYNGLVGCGGQGRVAAAGCCKADGVHPRGAGGYNGSRVQLWTVCWAVCI